MLYISGNPYINSKVQIKSFNARRHFYKIIDVWDFGWDKELGTVPPKNINKITLSLVSKFPQKRFIIHYLQPHSPLYIKKISNSWLSEPKSSIRANSNRHSNLLHQKTL
jgi:hypothetical protein